MDQSNISGFHFHSLGIVAANKSLDSNVIEVTPIEILSMQDGRMSDFGEKFEDKGKDSNSRDYEVKVVQGTTIEATWLPFGTNRFTSPDVRRGEEVIIYRFKDTDKYYWEPLKDGLKHRKLETAIFVFSATQEEGADINPDNYYFVEVSTHKGLIHIGTSQANGEAARYDIQVNTKEGFFKMLDNFGNYFGLNSVEEEFEHYTASGCKFTMEKKDLTAVVPGNTTINTTGDVKVNTTGNVSIVTKGINTIKGAVNRIIGQIFLMGPVSMTSEDGSSPGTMKMLGTIEHEGDMIQNGDLKTNNINAQNVTGTYGDFPNLD